MITYQGRCDATTERLQPEYSPRKDEWTKVPYGKVFNHQTEEWESMGGRWVISNGHLAFDIHTTVDGGIAKNRSKHGPPQYYIVSPREADEYADKIVAILNKAQL